MGEEFAPQEGNIGVLEAQARFDAGTPSFFIRVGRAGSGDGQGERLSYFLDLGDPSGRAIEIFADCWAVVDQPRFQFQRRDGHLPLPMPRRDGSIELLRPFVNLTEGDFRLMIAWVTAAIRPVGPIRSSCSTVSKARSRPRSPGFFVS